MKGMDFHMKKASVKGVLATLLILVFIFLALTGTLLYFGKTGQVWGIPRYELREAHFVAAVSMCVFAPVHLLLNLRVYRGELRTLCGAGRPKTENRSPEHGTDDGEGDAGNAERNHRERERSQ